MKNNIKRVFIKPDRGVSFSEQLHSCSQKILKYQNSADTGVVILKFSFFINSRSNKHFIELRNEISEFLNQKYKLSPTYSVIGQPPADDLMVVVELTVLENRSEDTNVSFKLMQQTPYTLVESLQGKEVCAGGISVKNANNSLSSQVEESYKIMKDILTAEALSFSDIVRQWNYVENIVQVNQIDNKPVQNYQLLNDTRSVYYSKCEFHNGFPAATGIGMNYGGILLEFYAVKPLKDFEIVSVKNPKQVDAYSYSQDVLVGDSIKKIPQKTTPKFERAKYISLNGYNTIYISGTASIHNEKTLGIDDVKEQTLVTIENIAELIAIENLNKSGSSKNDGTVKYSFLRIYVKYSSDFPTVKAICDKQFMNTPISYLIADICRDDLLVEIEGVAELL